MLQARRLIFAVFAILLSVASRSAVAQAYTDLHEFDCAVEGCSPDGPGLFAQGRDGNLYGTTPKGGTNGMGTVFKVTPGGTVTTLYNFDNTTGKTPLGGLTLASDGNFYGTTEWGGAYSQGTIFRITPSGAFTLLHSFNYSAGEGAEPYAPPIQASDGRLYGTTMTIPYKPYRITLGGQFTVLPNALPGQCEAPLIQASDGYLWGRTRSGGKYLFGAVFRLSLTGVVKTVYNFVDNGNYWGQLTQASDGNFYGITYSGGANGYGVAFRLTPSGGWTDLHDFDLNSEGGYPVADLVGASDGNFYGALSGGGGKAAGTFVTLTKSGTLMVPYTFGGSGGSLPHTMPMQHTSGNVYGTTLVGGGNNGGVFYSFTAALPQFVALMSTSGTPGKTVQILGQGFNPDTGVKFGTGSATPQVVSDTYMTAVVPDEGTTGYVTVTTGSGTLTSNKKFKVIPIIKSFTPTQGPVGAQVTITGGGFHGATKVTFGGVKATTFTVDSGSQITATVPSGALTGKIKVTTAGGNVNSKGVFTVN